MKIVVLLCTHSRFATRLFPTGQYAPGLFESFINYQRMFSVLRILRLFFMQYFFFTLWTFVTKSFLFSLLEPTFLLLFCLIYYLLFLFVICCLSLIKFWISQNIYLNHSSFSCFHLTLTVLFRLYLSCAISWDYLEFISLGIFFSCFFFSLSLLSMASAVTRASLNACHFKLLTCVKDSFC